MNGRDPVGVLAKQGIYAAVGIVLMLTLARFHYRRLRYFAAPFLLIAIALLVAVKIPHVGVDAERRPALDLHRPDLDPAVRDREGGGAGVRRRGAGLAQAAAAHADAAVQPGRRRGRGGAAC